MAEALYYTTYENWEKFHHVLAESHYERDDNNMVWVYASSDRASLIAWESFTGADPVKKTNRQFGHPNVRHYADHGGQG